MTTYVKSLVRYFPSLFLIGFLLLFSNPVRSQSPWKWARKSSGNAEGGIVTTDKFGNIYNCGYFISPTITFGSIVLTNYGTIWNACFAKYDSTGNLLWAKAPGGSSYIYDVATDNSGNVFITGTFVSPVITFGSIVLNRTAINSMYLAKYDPSGNVLWARTATANVNSEGRSLAIDKAGNIYVTGKFENNINFGSTNINSSSNLYIVKYDQSGNDLWCRNFTGFCIPTELATDANCNLYITGGFQSPTMQTSSQNFTNMGFEDLFIVKLDSSGHEIFSKSIGGADYEEGRAIVTDSFGNFYVAGIFFSPTISFGGHSISNSGCADIFITKYDTSGTALWAKKIGEAGNDQNGSGGLAVDPAGNIFMVGNFGDIWCGYHPLTIGPVTLSQPGAWDPMFILKMDPQGNTICANSLASGGNDQDYPNAIAVDNIGNAYLSAGIVTYPLTVGPFTLTGSGESLLLAKYVCNSSSPLPVELLYFHAAPIDNKIELRWTTASEINNDYFSIEKSEDGKEFNEIGKVNGAGNSSQLIDYVFEDLSPHFGISYYRLKQIDYDGHFEYSDIVPVMFNSGQNNFIIYPNPSANFARLIYDGKPAELFINDTQRKCVFMDMLPANEEFYDISVFLSPGIYFVEIRSKFETEYLKLVKE